MKLWDLTTRGRILRDSILYHSVVTGAPAATAFITLKDQWRLRHIEIRQQVVILKKYEFSKKLS